MFIFEGKPTLNETILASTGAMMECMNAINDRLAGIRIQGASLAPTRESWRPPEEGWVKVNVDGAYSRGMNKRACGGLIRDSNGKFLKGFIHPLEDGDELTAELWACFIGLMTVRTLGVQQVWLETDSTECLDLLQMEQGGNHRDTRIITEVRKLLQMDWRTKLTYIPRSGNSAADFLAKKGLETGLGHHEICEPSTELRVVLCSDCNGNYPIGNN